MNQPVAASSSWRSLAPALGLAGLSLCASLWLQSRPVANSRLIALVFPPWWSSAQSFAAAGQAGAVVRIGRFANIVVIAPDAGRAAPGVWLRLNPQALGACGALLTGPAAP